MMVLGSADRWAAERRRAAESVLGLPEAASVAEVRSAFLRLLSTSEFLPGSRVRDAFDVLMGRPRPPGAPLDEEVRAAEVARLHDRVERYAASFFDHPGHDRRAGWSELRQECAGEPLLLDRLAALEPGFEVDRAAISERHASTLTLAHEACRLFVLPPRRRAVSRQELLDDMASGARSMIDDWPRAAKRLRKRHRALAALEPELLDALIERGGSQSFRLADGEDSRSRILTGVGWVFLILVVRWIIRILFDVTTQTVAR
jgi:hypothetical protein